MAILARRTSDAILYALVAAHNASVRATAIVSTSFHADVTARTVSGDFRAPVATSNTITTADATDLPTCLVLAAELHVAYGLHIADGATTANLNCGAHKVPDVTNVLANPVPTDLTTLVAWVNDVKAKFNLHDVSTTYHYTADTVIATANATILADSITLINAVKAKFNTHFASAQASVMVKLIGP
jgi:hypothetical protein